MTDRDDELRDLAGDPAQDQCRAECCDDEPRLPLRYIVVLHAAGHAFWAQHVHRPKTALETPYPETKSGLSETLAQLEAKCLGKPVRVPCKCSEKHAANRHVVEMGHEKQGIVQHEIGRRH